MACNAEKLKAWAESRVLGLGFTEAYAYFAQNALATLPMLLIMLVSNEVRVLATSSLPAAGVAALLLSCVGGLGMSYFSFALRAVISATSFSVIGNICKVLTILVNIMMWDQHASEHPSAASMVIGSNLKHPSPEAYSWVEHQSPALPHKGSKGSGSVMNEEKTREKVPQGSCSSC